MALSRLIAPSCLICSFALSFLPVFLVNCTTLPEVEMTPKINIINLHFFETKFSNKYSPPHPKHKKLAKQSTWNKNNTRHLALPCVARKWF